MRFIKELKTVMPKDEASNFNCSTELLSEEGCDATMFNFCYTDGLIKIIFFNLHVVCIK